MQTEQWDDDMGDRVEREGRTASSAFLGGMFVVFFVLRSGITSCIEIEPGLHTTGTTHDYMQVFVRCFFAPNI